jgi:ribosomal protein S24E
MSYKFVVNGTEIACDTLAELKAALNGYEQVQEAVPVVQKGSQGSGPRRAWAEAEIYGACHGKSKFEARAILKARKDAAIASAMKFLSSSKE